MRGYRYLKDSNQLDFVLNLHYDLAKITFHISEFNSSKKLFGAGVGNVELIVRQFLMVRFAGKEFNKELLYALGKPGYRIAYAMPAEWIAFLNDRGFKISKIRSSILWKIQVLVYFLYGILSIVRVSFKGIFSGEPIDNEVSKFAYFSSLKENNIPGLDKNADNLTIISWYMQWRGKPANLQRLTHDVKNVQDIRIENLEIKFIPSAIMPFTNVSRTFKYLRWGFTAIFTVAIDITRGRWWSALLFNEVQRAAVIRCQDDNKIACDYLFHNSDWIYKPLWTYEAERRGARILFYFYSTNIENFRLAKGYSVAANFWHVTNWPNYLVWDTHQAEFIKRNTEFKTNIEVTGDIWFTSGVESNISIPECSIAMFDVTPFRDSMYQILGMECEYYVPEIAVTFLSDVQKVADVHNYSVVWKRKRNIGRHAHRKYTQFAEKISLEKKLLTVDPDVSVHSIINKCQIVISMPFTSTAIIARRLGKPSCYYDPSGLIKRDDRAAHGITIISGVLELEKWISNIKNSNSDSGHAINIRQKQN